MTPNLRLHRGDGGDDELTRLLRDHYRAPSDDAYWAALEGRILRTVREGDAGWAALDFAPWMRWAVIAASLLACVAGIAEWRARATESRLAYESVLDSQQPIARAVTQTGEQPAREATLRYLMTTY